MSTIQIKRSSLMRLECRLAVSSVTQKILGKHCPFGLAALALLLTIGTLRAQVPNPICYIPFDEGTGMTAHDAVGTNNATLLGAAGWTTGIVGAHALSDVLDEHGDVALPVSLTTGGASRVYASVTRNSKTGKLFIKVVNAAPAPQLVNFSLTASGASRQRAVRFF
jgi:hypothetical protein